MADSTGTMNYGGVTMSISKSDLVNALLPLIINQLSNNAQLLSQLTQAVTTAQLQKSRSTGTVLGNRAGSTPSGKSTGTNPNSFPH